MKKIINFFKKNNDNYKKRIKRIRNFLNEKCEAVYELNDKIRKKYSDFEEKMYIKTFKENLLDGDKDMFLAINTVFDIPFLVKADTFLRETDLGVEYEKVCSQYKDEKEFLKKLSEFVEKYPVFNIPALNKELRRKNYFFEIKDYTDFVNLMEKFSPENEEEKNLADFILSLAEFDIVKAVEYDSMSSAVVIDNKFYLERKNFLLYKEKIEKGLEESGNDFFAAAWEIVSKTSTVFDDSLKKEILEAIPEIKKEFGRILGQSGMKYNETAFYIFTKFFEETDTLLYSSASQNLKDLFRTAGFIYFKNKRFLNTIKFLNNDSLTEEEYLKFSKENEPAAEFLDKEGEVFKAFERILEEYPVAKNFLQKVFLKNGYYFYRNNLYTNPLSLSLIKNSSFYLYKNDESSLRNYEFSYDLILKIFKDNKDRLVPFVNRDSCLLNLSWDAFDDSLKDFLGDDISSFSLYALNNFKRDIRFHKLFNIFLKSLDKKELKKIYYSVYKNLCLKNNEEYNIFDYYNVYYLLKKKENIEKNGELSGTNVFDTENLKIIDSLLNKVFQKVEFEDLNKKTAAKGMEFVSLLKNAKEVKENLVLSFLEFPLENLTVSFLLQKKFSDLQKDVSLPSKER